MISDMTVIHIVVVVIKFIVLQLILLGACFVLAPLWAGIQHVFNSCVDKFRMRLPSMHLPAFLTKDVYGYVAYFILFGAMIVFPLIVWLCK